MGEVIKAVRYFTTVIKEDTDKWVKKGDLMRDRKRHRP